MTDPFTPLWQPVKIGTLELPNRLVMAPMTRNRAGADGRPTPDNATYYAQRASFGLVITEGTQASEDGQGNLLTPGMHTDGHVEGWRAVADSVHQAGGRLIIQLTHAGRVSHPHNTPHGRTPVAPSAVAAETEIFTMSGMQPLPVPRELTLAEINAVIAEFRSAARLAIEAGADGVEVHAAYGLLLHQFLSSNANQRTDGYGGSIENRIRFVLEVAAAVAEEIGSERTGIRISPGVTVNGVVEHDGEELYAALLAGLAPLQLAYLHLVVYGDDDAPVRSLRDAWSGPLLLNRGSSDLPRRVRDIENGLADVISVAALALANPDLPERLRQGAPLNEPDPTTFYGGDERGYLDYPTI